jgi:hypothetical protein
LYEKEIIGKENGLYKNVRITRNEYYPTRSNYGEKLNYEKADQRNIEYGMEI